MHMSTAALPPIQPPISDADRAHPLFPIYQTYRNAMANQLVKASAFRDWLFQYEQKLEHDKASAHPLYPAFVAWMNETKGGRRECPAGIFPHNMFFWIEGGRW